MCGRYALALSNEEVYDALENQLPRMFRRGENRWEREQDYRPNYNVAPRQRAPVVHRDNESGRAVVETMQWGLIPHWTKHPPTGVLNTINARSEQLLDPTSGGMWHALKGYKRCVVPAQGYYEWFKRTPSTKQAHFTRLPLGEKDTNASPPVLFFAGLYDVVHYASPVESRFQPRDDPETGEKDTREPYPTGNPIPLATFTILTTTPAKDIRWLHDRMPCILTGEEEIEKWLDLGEHPTGWVEGKGGTGDLLISKSGLDCFPVNPEVGKIGTNSPTYIQPVSERSDGIKSFFQKQQATPAKGGKSISKQTSSPLEGKAKPEHGEPEYKITPTDVERGLGDDSNAPNPQAQALAKHESRLESPVPEAKFKVEAQNPSPKRKRGSTEESRSTTKPATEGRKGGHQTQIVRKSSQDDAKKEQPAITSFFKSPEKVKSAKGQPPAKKSRR